MRFPTRDSESSLEGNRIGLSLITRVATIRSHMASRITWHSHKCFELLLLVDGATSYEFSDGSSIELHGGQFLLIPPHAMHRGVHDVRCPATLTGIMFDLGTANGWMNTPFTSSDLAWIQDQFEQGRMRSQRMSVHLKTLVKSLPQQYASEDLDNPTYGVLLRLSLCSILLDVAKQVANSKLSQPTETAQAAIQYMQQHLSEEFSIEQIAEALGCSRAWLFEVFKESTGLSPNDYLQRLRISRAQAMLVESKKTITEIAMDCGFSTSQYFSSVFRKYSGITPSSYRTREGFSNASSLALMTPE